LVRDICHSFQCGTIPPVNAALQERIKKAVDHGGDIAAEAQFLRDELAKNSTPGTSDREQKLEAKIRQIDEAMRPIRSMIGRLPHVEISADVESSLRVTSANLQYERRQLKKMQRVTL
jgi:polyhydroxyalkanoate synthesis regulator phasin